MTKQELLNTGYFIDNNFLDDYLQLVSKETDKSSYHIHHILPRQYYKKFNLPIDNSNNNLCKLSIYEHCYAHWLLYNCTKSWLKAGSAYAIRFILNTEVLKAKKVFSLDELCNLLSYYNRALADHCRPVYCAELDKSYNSLIEAALDVGLVSIGSIQKCCDQVYKTAAGYHWAYKEDTLNMEAISKFKKLKQGKFKKPRKVICLETLEIYNSPAEAALKLGVSEGRRISWCCNYKANMAAGYHWAWLNDTEAIANNKYKGQDRQTETIIDNTKKQIKCLETGIVYESITAAANSCHIARSAIRRSIRLGYRAGGYYWQRIK